MRLFGRRYDTGQPVCVETSGPQVARVVPADPNALGSGPVDSWP